MVDVPLPLTSRKVERQGSRLKTEGGSGKVQVEVKVEGKGARLKG
jgi:hypothetical protein